MEKVTISDVLRRQVFRRDNYTCRYCGFTGGPLHADHVYPESKGGETTLENLVTACPNCNMKKSKKVGIWPTPLEKLQDNGRHYQSLSKFVYYVFLAKSNLRDRVRGVKSAFPKLSANDIAIILECSPIDVTSELVSK